MKDSRIRTSIALIVMTALAGCQPQSSDRDRAGSPAAAASSDELSQTIDTVYQSPGARLRAPIDVKYRLLDTPRIGQPLSLELTLMPTVVATGFGFVLKPEDGLVVNAAQLTRSYLSEVPMTPERSTVSITPQREGRFYLRVVANVVVNGQSKSRTVTIPIQVGAGTRELETLGEVKIDADGERIISLPAKESVD